MLGILSLWINQKGLPLEKKNFTDIVRTVVARFNPVLNVSPIQFRRFNVTIIFQGIVIPKEEIESFLEIYSKLLNVSKEVMKKYYNRFNAHGDMVKALQKLQKPFEDEEFHKMIQEGLELYESTPEFQTEEIPDIDKKEIKGPIRLTYNDEEWLQDLADLKEEWLKYVNWNIKEIRKEVEKYVEKLEKKGIVFKKFKRKRKRMKNKYKRKKKIKLSNTQTEGYNLRKRKPINFKEIDDDEIDGETEINYDNEDDRFEVEKIIDHKIIDGKLYYKLKWKDLNEITWEPEESVDDCSELLDEYWFSDNNFEQLENKDESSFNEDISENKDEVNLDNDVDINDISEILPIDENLQEESDNEISKVCNEIELNFKENFENGKNYIFNLILLDELKQLKQELLDEKEKSGNLEEELKNEKNLNELLEKSIDELKKENEKLMEELLIKRENERNYFERINEMEKLINELKKQNENLNKELMNEKERNQSLEEELKQEKNDKECLKFLIEHN